MWIFLKKTYRELKESKGQFISVLAVVIIGVAVYTGLNSALEMLSKSGNTHFTEYRMADMWVSVYRAPESVLERVKSIPGVKMVAGRNSKDVRMSIDDRELIVRLISLPDTRKETVNDIQMKTGSYFSDDEGNQCLVSEEFLKANSLKIGEDIEPIINGDKVKLKLIGTAKSPEYMYEVRDAGQMTSDLQKFGVIYVKESYLQNILGVKGTVNDINILLNREDDMESVKNELEIVLKPYDLINITEKKDQRSYSSFKNNMSALKSLSAIFPIIFFIASAVIIYITMTRTIQNQRIQMGVLKALGYKNSTIMLHYQTYPIMVGLIGSIIGSIAGTFVIGRGMFNTFNTLYHLPAARTVMQVKFVLPATLLALLFCIIAGFNACRKELALVPAQSMRQKTPASGRKIFIEKIEVLWKNMNFSWKIIMRNLFRYKKRSILASVGIIFSMALLLVAIGIKDSVNNLMEVQYAEIEKYDIKIGFTSTLSTNELSYIKSIDHILSVEPVLETSVKFKNGWIEKDIGLIALDRDSTLYGVLDKNGDRGNIPENGILLSHRLVDVLNINVGEKAEIRSFYPGMNEEKDEKITSVRGVTTQYLGQSAVCSMDYLKDFLKEEPIANAAYIKLDDIKNQEEVINKLKDILTIKMIQSKAEAVSNNWKALASMNSIVAFMICGASVLAFAIIYNITNINIFERRREIATLSVIGFNIKELKTIIFNENFFVSTFGILMGIPPGLFLLRLIVRQQTSDSMQMPAVLEPRSFLIAVLIIIGFTALSNKLLTKNIKSINMVESLKSAE